MQPSYYNYAKQQYKFSSMIPLILLIVLCDFTQSAIISTSNINKIDNRNPIISLNQNFQYELLIRNNNIESEPYLRAYFSFASTNISCSGFKCYYGWLSNYTYKATTFIGQISGSSNTLTIFSIVVFENKTFSVTTNTLLQDGITINLLDMCSKFINPLFAQISNLNPYNNQTDSSQLAVYHFEALDLALKRQLSDNQWMRIMNLTTLSNNIFENQISVGWNVSNHSNYTSFQDVIAIDNSTNHIIQRSVGILYRNPSINNKYIQMSLKSSSTYSDLTLIRNGAALLSNNKQNINYFSIYPNTIELSLLKLFIP